MQVIPTTLDAILPLQPPTARLVLNSLHHIQEPATLLTLCLATGSSAGTLEKVVRKLIKDGYLIRTAHGSAPFFSLSAAVVTEAR
jgi:hypothetical protein